MNKEDRVHVINIGLIGMSLVAAFILPFEVFLFAYAVLGPLHYLTEINWLNKKDFFIKKKKQVWILVLFTILLCVPLCFKYFSPHFFSVLKPLIRLLQKNFGVLLFLGFVTACGLVYLKRPFYIFLLVLSASLLIYLFNPSSSFYIMTAVMLPTLIHVYLFTLIFMLYGVVKSGNRIGIIEVLCLILVPLLIAFWPTRIHSYNLGSYTFFSFKESNFSSIHVGIGKLFHIKTLYKKEAFFHSDTGIRIQIFIAFAYLYHYLNWFTKVSVIGWLKNTSFYKTLLLIVLWLISVGIYWYDYKTGLNALFFLSLLHVILEFPLNIVSLKVVSGYFIKRVIHLTKHKQTG